MHRTEYGHTGIMLSHFQYVCYSRYVWYTGCVWYTKDRISVSGFGFGDVALFRMSVSIS